MSRYHTCLWLWRRVGTKDTKEETDSEDKQGQTNSETCFWVDTNFDTAPICNSLLAYQLKLLTMNK